MTTFIDRLKTTIYNIPGLTGDFSIYTPVPSFITFDSSMDGMSFDITAVDGYNFEIRKNCVYSNSSGILSRGTLIRSSTGTAIDLTQNTIIAVSNIAENILSINVTSPSSGQFLTFDGNDWVNQTISVGTTLAALEDVQISGVPYETTSSEILGYNPGLSKWENIRLSTHNISDFIITGTPSTGQILSYTSMGWRNISAPWSTTLAGLIGDVSISFPLANQALIFNGISWNNQSIPIPSINLSNLEDVDIISPQETQGLIYNGISWSNTQLPFVSTNSTLGPSITPASNSISIGGGITNNHNGAIAIGDGTMTDNPGEFTIGFDKFPSGTPIKISNIMLAGTTTPSASDQKLFVADHSGLDGTDSITLPYDGIWSVAYTLIGTVVGDPTLYYNDRGCSGISVSGSLCSEIHFDPMGGIESNITDLFGSSDHSRLTFSANTISMTVLSSSSHNINWVCKLEIIGVPA